MTSLVATHLMANSSEDEGLQGYTQYEDYKRAPDQDLQSGEETAASASAPAYVPPEV
jgi:hypothetical protein